MKEIKLTIDGKEVQLTSEQIKALGIDVDDGCVCDIVKQEELYWYIDSLCHVEKSRDLRWDSDKELFLVGNYYRSKPYAKQIALHQKLNNLLRRYSEQHGGDAEWDGEYKHYHIGFDMTLNNFCASYYSAAKINGVVYFSSRKIAEEAIEEVVKPFMAEHPDFVW